VNLQFRCGTELRRQKVAESSLNGIDYLEVDADQVHLHVHFVGDLGTSPALTLGNVFIGGGVRIKGIQATHLDPSPQAGLTLTVTASAAGDFSTYTLRLQKAADDPAPPDGYDQVLSAVSFSFRAACASDFDCEPQADCPEPELLEPVIDYLAKDYTSFRRLMLDRLAVTTPDWTERNPADLLVTLVELLAYVGDDLSYRQDAIAAESYLGTCRHRVSARRHARLLDYHVHEGCNARAWVHFASQAVELAVPAGTQVVSGTPEEATFIADLRRMTGEPPVVFETMHPIAARSAHNQVQIYTWGDSSCCLPQGATAATLVTAPGMSLAAGDFLLLEEVLNPLTGRAPDADPTHRQVVRLTRVAAAHDTLYNVDVVDVEWAAGDALTFPLCISADVSDPTNPSGGTVVAEVAVARGNIALADHGLTVPSEALLPDTVPVEGEYQPGVARGDLTFAAALSAASAGQSASGLAVADPRQALPAIRLTDEVGSWAPKYDLLDSDRFRQEFVVEMEDDRTAHLRFGDDVHGRRPAPGTHFAAVYRVGTGSAGNVGREVLRRVAELTGVDRVRNPLPAAGGVEPELLEAVRQMAPQAFRTQERAVTEADYVAVARRHPEVLNAAARMRWTGSWWTVFLTVERRGGRDVDPAFRSEVMDFIDQFRLAGYDLEVEAPVFVPLDIELVFCNSDGYFPEDVRRSLLDALTRLGAGNGRPGFFAPDNFTFGQPVYLSRLYAAALAVPGVQSVVVTRFQRWGKLPAQELENGLIKMAVLEIARLANDPNFPEEGRLEIVLGGAA
jgi:hypothetical protein